MATVELPDQSILLARALIGFALFAMYSFNIGKAYHEWHVSRDWDSFRQFLMAFELEFGVLLILLGYINTAFFAQNEFVTDILRTLGLGLLGVLIVGGVTLIFSWRKPREIEEHGS